MNLTPDSSSDASSQSSTKAKKSSDKKGKAAPAKLDTSLSNPTPAMLAILARMRSREETPSPALPAKKKQARSTYSFEIPIDRVFYILFKKKLGWIVVHAVPSIWTRVPY